MFTYILELKLNSQIKLGIFLKSMEFEEGVKFNESVRFIWNSQKGLSTTVLL